jgi:hypothetical protein
MLSQIEDPFRKVESLKLDMLRILGSLTDNELQTPHSSSYWSPLGILEHIVLVEEWTAGPNEEPLPENAQVLVKGRLFVAFVNRFMRFGVRVPTVAEAEPSTHPDLTSLMQRWDKSRDLLKAKLQVVRKETLNHPIAVHPIAGPLDALRVLGLLEVHLIYHLRQLPKR